MFGHDTMDDIQQQLDACLNADVPVCPVTSSDLLAIGFTPGPDLGLALQRVRDYWLDSDCQVSKEECLELFQGF
jgi:hypothetical protein